MVQFLEFSFFVDVFLLILTNFTLLVYFLHDILCILHLNRYLIFINLEKFSLFNNPTMASSRETIKMLCECFPERLGKQQNDTKYGKLHCHNMMK